MTARHRTLDSRNGVIGSYDYYLAAGPVYRTALQGEERVMDDHIGNFPEVNPLDLKITTVYRPLLSGLQAIGSPNDPIRVLEGYPVDYVPAPPDPNSYLAGLGAGDVINYGWETLAKTNISQPHVSLPTLIGESKDHVALKDLPGYVKNFGANILKDVAKGYVSWRWALRPLMSDLVKLWNFRDAIYKKRLDLQLLDKQKTSRRRADLYSDSYTGTVQNNVNISTSTGFTVRGSRQVLAEEQVWGVVKWKLDPSFELPEDDSERYNYARKLVFGITSHELLATAWELTPWSWFADWFYGIGNVIAATNNSVPCTWSGNCVMQHTVAWTKWTVTQAPPAWATMSGVPVERTERKRRFVAVPILPFLPSFRPLVSGRTWSILTSLAALRFPKLPQYGSGYRKYRERLLRRVAKRYAPFVPPARWAVKGE